MSYQIYLDPANEMWQHMFSEDKKAHRYFLDDIEFRAFTETTQRKSHRDESE